MAQATMIGEVVKIAPYAWKNRANRPDVEPEVEIGETVVTQRYSGVAISITNTKTGDIKKYKIINEDEIMCVLEENEEVKIL